jgi:hypothetical protein
MSPADRARVDAFAASGDRFCRLLESHAGLERRDLLRKIHHALAELYALGLALPIEADVSDSEPPDAGNADALYRALGAKLGEWDCFQVVFEPFSKEEPVTASLADGLRDVYLGFKEGRMELERGKLDDALFCWRLGVLQEWGRHAAEALMALQSLANSDYC